MTTTNEDHEKEKRDKEQDSGTTEGNQVNQDDMKGKQVNASSTKTAKYFPLISLLPEEDVLKG